MQFIQKLVAYAYCLFNYLFFFQALTMASQYDKLSWKGKLKRSIENWRNFSLQILYLYILLKFSYTEVRDLLRIWRDDGERRSKDVVDLWELKLMPKIDQLGNESTTNYSHQHNAANCLYNHYFM